MHLIFSFHLLTQLFLKYRTSNLQEHTSWATGYKTEPSLWVQLPVGSLSSVYYLDGWQSADR